ncbi:MAG: hypothetical protein V3R54_00500, partial [Thermodesulfovibrionia bacterium]
LSRFFLLKPATSIPLITVKGVTMGPSFHNSFIATLPFETSRSVNLMPFCERNSFTFLLSVQPFCV